MGWRMSKEKYPIKMNVSALLFIIAMIVIILDVLLNLAYRNDITQLQSTQTKLEKRVDNLTQAMQTKDKELESGLRNTQNGLMLKIDYLEKQIGVGE